MSTKTLLSLVASCLIVAVPLGIAGCSGGGSDGPTAPPDPSLGATSDTSTGPIDQAALASIDIEKRTNGVDADSGSGPSIPVGQTVTWSYSISNTGTETLTDIAATDDPEGEINCPQTSLIAGESMDCTDKTGIAALGPYTNTATVTAQAASGSAEDSDNSAYTGVDGDVTVALDLEKQTNGEDADTETGPILLATEGLEQAVEWTYIVTNNSSVEATNIVVTDNLEGPVTCPADSLAPTASMTCGPVEGTAEPNQYENEGSVTAQIDGQTVTATDLSHYFGSDPAISMVKKTDGIEGTAPNLVPGCPVTWTYELTNDGNIDLEQIQVIDTPEGAATCPSGDLPEGSGDPRMICEITGEVGTADYTNEASVSAQDPVGNTVSAQSAGGYTVLNQPPVCDNAIASPAELWPPNHGLVQVSITNIVDACERDLTVRFDGVYQDEPVNGTGDGDTSPDATGVGTSALQVRSERQGGGDGRVYYIDFTVTDPAGDGCQGQVMVMVPHDQSGDLAIDSGPPYYDSVTGAQIP